MTIDAAELELLSDALRKTMLAVPSGPELDAALAELGWTEMADDPALVALVFRLLGETGAHAAVLTDVVGAVPLPYAGGRWVVWERGPAAGSTVDAPLPLRTVSSGSPVPLAAGRRALGWWLVGTSRTMLALARAHVLDRVQFGKPLASFQAVRHRLAETLVAVEGAEATLVTADDLVGGEEEDLAALLAKAAAGKAALTAARHCQQVLGGIGFTAEHDLHHHVKRVLVLDGLLGSSRALTREAGTLLRKRGTTPRLAQL
jgi:hypothetical protein